MKDIKSFAQGGLDTDSAPEYVAKNDWVEAYNVRVSGTTEEEGGYLTNLESTTLITGTRGAGINKCTGAERFETLRIGIAFIYNSAGFHQIINFDYDTQVQSVLYTNLTDSGGINLLPLDPEFYVNDIKLINDEFLFFVADNIPPCLISYTRLKNGDFGTLLEDDFSLIKKQTLQPPIFYYNNDGGRSVNLLSEKLFQFRTQRLGFDYDYSAWSTISKRNVPTDESTTTIGTDVTKNNNLVVSVDIGDTRTKTVIIGARYSLTDWFEIKRIDRDEILALPFDTVDVDTEVYEAYDPVTNTYSFAFYNDGLYQNVPVLETDLQFDNIPLKAGAGEVLNGNLIALGDTTFGYERPTTKAMFGSVAYDPNISVPVPVYDFMRVSYTNPGDTGSGQGNHKRFMQINFLGLPKQGDKIRIVLTDIRDSNNTIIFEYPVPFARQDNLLEAIHDVYSIIDIYPDTNATYRQDTASPQVILTIVGPPYFGLGNASVILFNAGSGISKSIHSWKSNSSYQFAISYRDKFGRFFPLLTNKSFIVKTQSYAQADGLTSSIQWQIQTVQAPIGAVDYQILASQNNTHEKTLYINGALLSYKGAWNASTNTGPTLAAGTGTVGDTYNVTAPGTQNLGNGSVSFNQGDGVVYNGLSWDKVDKSFGDLSDTSKSLVFTLAPLDNFNKKNLTSILNYDYVMGDRCTFAYYLDDDGDPVYFNNPCIDVEVLGFSPLGSLLKVRKPTTIDTADIVGQDVLLEVYTPKKRTTTNTEGVEENAATLYYEIGERYTITNGNHDVLEGTLKDGDAYFKTRELSSAVNPNTLLSFVVEDFNFSDFYISNYTSYGRPRSYYDVLERTRKKATIVYSDLYIIGSKVNGLSRFYPERVYGDGDGESSSSYGAINKLIQRNNFLVCIQELKIGYIPVFGTIIQDQAETENLAISDRILNKIRYNQSGNVGLGGCKESVAVFNNNIYIIDPNRSEPFRIGLDGVTPIAGKMLKFFKKTLQQAYASGKKIIGFYDVFNNEYVISTETAGNVVTTFTFNPVNWEIYEPYTITNGNITAVGTPIHGSNGALTAGKVTYTPSFNYTGSDGFNFTFTTGGNTVTKNVCLTVIAGSTTVYLFSLNPQTGQPTSTYIYSNTVLVQGNTIPASVSIVNGQYNINGGAYTNAAGFVNAGDIVQVRQMSAATENTLTTATLTIAQVTAPFDVTTEEGIPLGDFDFAVLRPEWITGSGSDLDTFTYLTGTGTIYDGDPSETSRVNRVGFAQNPLPPATSGSPPDNRIIPRGSSAPYLNWATDNTGGSGVEAILLDFKKFIADFPSAPVPLLVEHALVWYSARGTGAVTLSLKTYKGGTMTFNATTKDFDNTGGVLVNNISQPINVVNNSSSSLLLNAQKVARVSYNKTTLVASLTLL